MFIPVGSPGRRPSRHLPSHLFVQLCHRCHTADADASANAAAADVAVLHLRTLFIHTFWDGTLALSSSSAEGGDVAYHSGQRITDIQHHELAYYVREAD